VYRIAEEAMTTTSTKENLFDGLKVKLLISEPGIHGYYLGPDQIPLQETQEIPRL
jgi:hypothetical protein